MPGTSWMACPVEVSDARHAASGVVRGGAWRTEHHEEAGGGSGEERAGAATDRNGLLRGPVGGEDLEHEQRGPRQRTAPISLPVEHRIVVAAAGHVDQQG